MTDRRASRRDFLRILRGALPGKAPEKRTVPKARRTPVPIPVEGGKAILDLARYPVPPSKDLPVTPADLEGSILVVRPGGDHYAAVAGDCPRCGEGLRFDPAADAVVCVGGDGAWRLDGLAQDGSRDLRIACFVVRRAGPRVEIDLVPPPDV